MANYTTELENLILNGLSNNIIKCYEKLESNENCCHQSPSLNVLPWSYEIDCGSGDNYCNPIIKRRAEKGWTINMVFNRENLDWVSGSTFYYWGIVNEFNPSYFVDNNLSFSFTTEGSIKWSSYRYSGYCETESGYTESFYTSTGETLPLCSGGTLNDFSITIVFKRYKELYGCDLVNMGGQNDYITGWTVTNPYDVLTGATEEINITETVSEKWLKEREDRLGVLKIYLNGFPIKTFENWEEIIPSRRGSDNGIYQRWGKGTLGYVPIHNGECKFKIKDIKYFEEPLDFNHVKHFYLTKIKTIDGINITECQTVCDDNLFYIPNLNLIQTEDDEYIITEDDNILIF